MTAPALALSEGFRQPRDPICYLCGYGLHHHRDDTGCVGGRDIVPRPLERLSKLMRRLERAAIDYGRDPRDDDAFERRNVLSDRLHYRLWEIDKAAEDSTD